MHARISSPADQSTGNTVLRVRQHKEWGQILTGWETRNRYSIEDQEGQPVLFAGETGTGLGAVLLRHFLKNKRPFTIEIRDPEGGLVLTVKRPWRFWLSRAEVTDGTGQQIGAIQQRWAFFKRRFTVEDQLGRPAAEIEGPFFKPWTFEVHHRGGPIGWIRKRWSGLLKEAFTQADNFSLELAPTIDDQLRPLCLAATFLVDFVYFERR